MTLLFENATQRFPFVFCNDPVRPLQLAALTEGALERVGAWWLMHGTVDLHTGHRADAIVVNENEPPLQGISDRERS